MGADTKQLRTRIKSVDSTLHLTKAMGLVASSKIRKALDSMYKGKEFASALEEIISTLTSYDECKKTAYMSKRDGGKTRLIVVAGDRGLAGGYNANIFRLLREYPDVEVTPIGKRACDKYGKEVVRAEGYSYQNATLLANEVCEDFLEGKCDKVGIVCTRYNSMMSQEAYVKWILPLESDSDKKSVGAIFEPDELSVLNAIIPEYIAGVIISCVKESFASEVASRRVAMDSAGKNAQEMINKLELEYNRARQGAITQEITEIVAGSGI
ncbi:MAG: ATP synthase F1 subunit gamma [Clostridia bacterium]|nr:ATP synthase F1 subunit gamma [Clostridia bacterium]